MKLIDFDQQIFVPITDETKGGVTYEMGMSLGEFLDGICEGFKPEAVEAIPVKWMEKYMQEPILQESIYKILFLWQKEQEART